MQSFTHGAEGMGVGHMGKTVSALLIFSKTNHNWHVETDRPVALGLAGKTRLLGSSVLMTITWTNKQKNV